MFTIYSLFKFLHVAAVIVWVGGVFTLVVLNARLAREQNRSAQMALSEQSEFFGSRVIGPAAITTLLAGIIMVLNAGFGFSTLWITWGFVGVFGSIILGAIFIRRATEELRQVAASPTPDAPRIQALQRRLINLNALNLLLLLSTVGAMVFKPTL
ncbi:MAG: DUF2269 family protein [Ardenticatenaceae bacterium]